MRCAGELLNDFGALTAPERSQQPLLLVTTVDIGGGKSDRIEVRRGDVPMDVATAFVTKHSLPPAIIPRLAVHLEENLAKVESQKQAAVSCNTAVQLQLSALARQLPWLAGALRMCCTWVNTQSNAAAVGAAGRSVIQASCWRHSRD